MPVTHRVQTFKTRDNLRFWTNVFHISASDIATALIVAEAIAGVEQGIYPAAVTIARVLVHELSSGYFSESLVNLSGTSPATGQPYPDWNIVRTVWTSSGINRPPQTLWRGVATEDTVDGTTLTSGFRSALSTTMAGLISAVVSAGGDLLDIHGTAITAGTVQAALGNRQLHRKRRRAP